MRAILLALTGLLAMAAADKKVVCYFGSWAARSTMDFSEIDPTLCTHLIYSFVGVQPNGDVKILDEDVALPNGYRHFNEMRQRAPGVKTMLAMGGWIEGPDPFSPVMMNPDTRRRFVNSVYDFVKKHGFDGFDLDWEYPNKENRAPADKQNYVTLLKELRKKFNPDGLLVSIAVSALRSAGEMHYIIPEIVKSVDFINVMTYDIHGSWEQKTGNGAPLYAGSQDPAATVEAGINYWLSEGAPAEKLILGVPMYGPQFLLANPSNNGVGAPATGAATLAYNDICKKIRNEGWTAVFDEGQQVPHAYKGNKWVGYDDERSIKVKAEFAKSKGLGGMMIWSIQQDDFKGVCGEKFPLLKVINREFRGASVPGSPSKPTATRPKPVTSKPTMKKRQRPASVPGSPSKPTATRPKPVTSKPTMKKRQRPAKPFVPSAPAKPSVPSAPSSGNICNAKGYFRDSKNCNVFYYCQSSNGNYSPVRFACPPGLYYNGEVCDYPRNVPGC